MVGVFIALDSHQQLLQSDFLTVVSFVMSHSVCVCVCVCDLCLAVLGRRSCAGVSLAVVSRGPSPARCSGSSWGLLLWAQALGCAGFRSCGSWAVEHGLRGTQA